MESLRSCFVCWLKGGGRCVDMLLEYTHLLYWLPSNCNTVELCNRRRCRTSFWTLYIQDLPIISEWVEIHADWSIDPMGGITGIELRTLPLTALANSDPRARTLPITGAKFVKHGLTTFVIIEKSGILARYSSSGTVYTAELTERSEVACKSCF